MVIGTLCLLGVVGALVFLPGREQPALEIAETARPEPVAAWIGPGARARRARRGH